MHIKPSKILASLPPYVFAEIEQLADALRAHGVLPIDFGAGDPSEPTPDYVAESLTPAGRSHATSGYPSYVGSPAYRESATEYMQRRFGVTVDAGREVCATIGSKEAVFHFPRAILESGDVVICPSPGYPPFKTGTIFAEGKPYFVPLLPENKFLIDYEAIPEDVARKAKIIWINYPNSPTGAVASREYYKGLVDWAHRYNIIIAADEGCYIDIYYDEPPPSILEVDREGIIAFYSLSKRNNMTGYRVGFVCGDERIISIFKRLKTNIDSGVAHVIQDAAIRGLADDTHVEAMRRLYKEKRDILLPALRSVGLPASDSAATFYIWQKVPGSDMDFAKKLLDPSLGIVVTPGSLISDPCEGGVNRHQRFLAPRLENAKDQLSHFTRSTSPVNPGVGYVRIALVPPVEQVREAARRLQSLKQ